MINGGSKPNPRLIEYLSGAYYAIAITGACLGLVIWSLHQESRINQIEIDLKRTQNSVEDFAKNGSSFSRDETRALEYKIDTVDRREADADRLMNERLNAMISSMTSQFNSSSQRVNELEKHVNDTAGNSAIIKERQDVQIRQLDAIEKNKDAVVEQRGAVDILKLKIERIEEQQSRIIQALDNTYNTLQEALRGGNITRQPTPYAGPTGPGAKP